MSDLYSELLVKKKQTAKDMVVKYGLIVLTVIMAIGGLLVNGLLLVPAVALGVACYFVIPKTDLEYEYLFVNGELDIDMIMSKSKRKSLHPPGPYHPSARYNQWYPQLCGNASMPSGRYVCRIR